MIQKYSSEDNKHNVPAKRKCNKDKGANVRQCGLKEFTRTLRRVKNNSRSLNNANFATINTKNKGKSRPD